MPGYELIGEEEKKLVSSIFEENGGVLFAHGFDGLRKRYFVKEFENSLSNFFNAESAVTTSSGTASIFCALKSKKLIFVATKKILSLFCGSPKFFKFNTLHSTLYPSLLKELIMIFIVFLLS